MVAATKVGNRGNVDQGFFFKLEYGYIVTEVAKVGFGENTYGLRALTSGNYMNQVKTYW